MGLDLVVKFYIQFDIFVKILRLLSLVNETGIEFLGESSFESYLLRLGIVFQNHHELFEFSIINAEFMVALFEIVQFLRAYSKLIRVTEGSF
jgi:hypothetical protein